MKPATTNNNRGGGGGLTPHMLKLHQRLLHALSLGHKRPNDGGGWKWCCSDVEIQKLAVRSIDAFLNCVSKEASQHPLVKNSVADMIQALESAFLFENEFMLRDASEVVGKVIRVLGSSVNECQILTLVHSLSALLCSCQIQVATSCAASLILILSHLSTKMDKEVWEILKRTGAVDYIICYIKDFSGDTMPIGFVHGMISLLSVILWRCPPSRYRVWNNTQLMEVLNSISVNQTVDMKVAILKLYASIALCAIGAKNLLEKDERVLGMLLQCMDVTNPYHLQVEAFKLAECFALSEQGLLRLAERSGLPFIRAIISGLDSWILHSRNLYKDQLFLHSCRLAKITCLAGEHHNYFWNMGIESILLHLISENFHSLQEPLQVLSLQEQIDMALKFRSTNYLLGLRTHVWDILGGLTTHCLEDFDPKMIGNEFHLKILITCACLDFADSLCTIRHVYQDDSTRTYVNESASRAVLLMTSSSCKYISSQARSTLSKILKPNAKSDIQHILNVVNAVSSGNKNSRLNNLQIVISVISLACYSSLPEYRELVMKNHGMKLLLSFKQWWLENPVKVKRSNVAPHLDNILYKKMCCYDCGEHWEGEEMVLLFCLWGLAELIHHSSSLKDRAGTFASQIESTKDQIIAELEEICINSCASGPKWYASYLLSYFGFFGFPTKLGKRIGEALDDKDHSSLTIILANEEHIYVHGIFLRIRCPLLLPAKERLLTEKTSIRYVGAKFRISAHVDRQILLKLLEYVYFGYFMAGEDDVKKLKTLAKHCNLQELLLMLSRRKPKWRTPFPSFELTSALGASGYDFSDIILEAKANKSDQWACNVCLLSAPHMHVHKVVLCSSCYYFRAMFRSGMNESFAETLSVPVSWETLVKLVSWFYSGELLKPQFGCLWDNLDVEEKICEVELYLELYCLSDYWSLEELQAECSRIIVSCLDSDWHLAIRVIEIAAECLQFDLIEVAANYLAPFFQQLRISGELERLDENVVEMVRSAAVRLTLEDG